MAAPREEKATTPRRVGVREFRANMTGFLRQVRRGRSLLITSRGEAIALIEPPPASARARREPGALSGRIGMAPDFDVWPADVLDSMLAAEE